MKARICISRSTFLGCCMGLVFAALTVRLTIIHWFRRAALAAEGFNLTKMQIVRLHHRGEIQDANGTILAVSERVVCVCADPTLIRHRAGELAAWLAPVLGVNRAALEERFRLRVIGFDSRRKPIFDQHVLLKRHVRLSEWNRIQAVLKTIRFANESNRLDKEERTFLKELRAGAFFSEPDELRLYPYGASAAHVVGHVRIADGGFGQTGQAGVELQFDDVLRGSKGWVTGEKDAQGRELREFRREDVASLDGLNVKLTIDIRAQAIVQEELYGLVRTHLPSAVGCIVVEPATGAIRALVSLPDYDPSQPGGADSRAIYNRVVREAFEPGSVFKVIVLAAGLNEGRFSMDRVFFCENGVFPFRGVSLHDAHPHGYLTAEDVIVKSSNIGAAKMGLELGAPVLNFYLRRFGFGERTGIPLSWESAGVAPPPEAWSSLALTRIPMGHEIGVTAIQLAMAYGVLGNRGELMFPMLVDSLSDIRGKTVFQLSPKRRRRVVEAAVCRSMLNALERVASRDGTAPLAAMSMHRLAAKTGTAVKWKDGRYLHGRYVCTMAGLFPASSPALCIVIVADDPDPRRGYYAGTVCGPYLKRISERLAVLFGIPPDKSSASTPQMAAAR